MLLRLAAAALLASPVLIAAQTRTPVLVELFTSEGCSSCPPADALLARLNHDQPIPNAEIIVLGEHVDYWDSLGWHDRFSSHAATERQTRYSSRFHLPDIYTPQMVVAGQAQFVGNDDRAATRAIAQAARSESLPLEIHISTLSAKTLTATLHLTAPTPQAEVLAAFVDPEDTTQVRSGENGGKTLHHVAVVRSLTQVGTLPGQTLNFTLPVPESQHPLRLVVFVQTPNQGPVLGAVAVPVSAPDRNIADTRN